MKMNYRKTRRILFSVLFTVAIIAVFWEMTQKPICLAQGDIAVQLITSGSAYVFEHYASYDGVTGDPNVNTEVLCETVRDKEKQTVLLYGILSFPDADGSGDVNLWFTPSRGIDWGGVLTTYTGNASGVALVNTWALSLYPGCTAKFMWTNPGTIKWNLVYYTRALVN
jgi:hypothetical protein